ncbi:hypothetical protein KBC40_03015 [Patescibacteria group bacterium]|jgi:hypothetical protein|nr:hypothetical protein [Patescibacteria group bacterium]
MLHLNNNPSNLKIVRRCPVCASEYNQNKIQVLEESEYGLLTYITCQTCGSNLLTKISTLSQGLVGQAILTDLKAIEVINFAGGDDLTADEVLQMQFNLYNKKLINQFRLKSFDNKAERTK